MVSFGCIFIWETIISVGRRSRDSHKSKSKFIRQKKGTKVSFKVG
jgi:hypothetical protein